MIEIVTSAFTAAQAWLFETCVQPLLYTFGWMRFQETAYDATEWFLLGLAQILVLYLVLRPLEALFPAERWGDRRGTRVDVIYTLLHRLGLFPLFFFFAFRPLFDAAQAWLRLHDVPAFGLETLLPGLAASPLAAFFVYLVVLDFAQYWVHRAQHRADWWWALHAVHHSQRQMTFWTDNRNHLLDSVITDSVFAAIALAIGVPPAQFALLVVLSRMVESLAHANVRLSFGAIGDRLLVSPRFHRLHHAMVASPHGDYRGANYAVLLPLWDVLFGTADFRREPGPTGIEDQLAGRDYGEGFWAQQRLGLQRLLRRA